MANGDKLYTVSDQGVVKVLKDTAGTNALVKAFDATSEDSIAPTGLEILNPSGDQSRITSSGLVLHCKSIANSIYAWIPWVLYADADSGGNVDALRLGFDGDGAYYWWTYDRSKKYITVSLDNDGNLLISGDGASPDRYFKTSGVQCWVPFLLPSTIKNSKLLTVTENNVEKLTSFNSHLLLQRRGYEQQKINGVTSDVKYPAWHIPLAIKGDSQGAVDVDDYFNWSIYDGVTNTKLLTSDGGLYNFSFTTDSAVVGRSVKLSSLFAAWIAPTSYWYDTTSSLSTGLNPLLNNVLTKATDNKIIIANNGALSQDITSDYQIPNYRQEGYLLVLDAGICNPHAFVPHVIGYSADKGFWYSDHGDIKYNDHMGVQFQSTTCPDLRYALTINTNTAPVYNKKNQIKVQNLSSEIIYWQGIIDNAVPAFSSRNFTLSSGTNSYTITNSSYGLSNTVTLDYNSDTGRLIQVDIAATTVNVTNLNVDSGSGSVNTTNDISAPTPYYTPVDSSQWEASPANTFEVTYVRPNPQDSSDYANNVRVTVRRKIGGGQSAAEINFNGTLALTITKKWQ